MSGKKERRIQHYKSSQRILLVGEGDFSFSACLAKAFRHADNMVATCLESEEWFNTKHWSGVSNVECLESRGCTVLFEVDAHDMDKHPTLVDIRFDVIVFNFPHAGHVSWLCETDTILIERHKRLIRGFFRSARELVDKEGEIHVTHRDDEPYCQWRLEEQALTVGLLLKEKVPFVKERYRGYHNKRGSDIKGNKQFPILCPFTSKFCVAGDDDLLRRRQILPISNTNVGDNNDLNNSNDLDDEFKMIAISTVNVSGNCEKVKNSLVNDEVIGSDDGQYHEQDEIRQEITKSDGHDDLDDNHQEIAELSTLITATPSSVTDEEVENLLYLQC